MGEWPGQNRAVESWFRRAESDENPRHRLFDVDEEAGYASLGCQANATLTTTGGENRTAGAGTHTQTETVHLCATAIVGLKGPLAHDRNSSILTR